MLLTQADATILWNINSGDALPNETLLPEEVTSLPVHSFSYQHRPCDAFLPGARVDLVHLRRASGAFRDKVHGFVIMSHLPNY